MAVAVMAMTETPKRVHESEPEGPGYGLLCRWAWWYRGGLPGSAGEWSVKQRIGPAKDIDPPKESQLVERIVAELGVRHPQYLRMLKRYFLNELAYWEIAGQLQYTTGFVKLSIQAACDYVARRFDELNG